jgi:hypothetical protein
MKKTLLITALMAALAGCATDGTGTAAAPATGGDKEFDALIAQVETEAKAAGKLGMQWRDTQKTIDGAKEAMKAGEKDKAMKLAKKALKEAQLAQAQAAGNANAGPKY